MTEEDNSDYQEKIKKCVGQSAQSDLNQSKSVSFGGVSDMQKDPEEGQGQPPEEEERVSIAASATSAALLDSMNIGSGDDLDVNLLDEDVLMDKGADNASGETSYEEVETEVEEDGDEETDEFDDEGEPVKKPRKIKVKRMVKRKKKKTKMFMFENREKSKGSQMPEWTEALEIEYMNKDELHRVVTRLRKENMTESDLKLAEDLHYSRATYQMDQYVKLTEVRGIVNEAVNSILDRMGKADQIARKNRTEVILLDNKLKGQQQQVNHLKRLENGQNSLIRLQKEQQSKLAESMQMLTDIKYDMVLKREERKVVDQDFHLQLQTQNNKSLLVEAQMTEQIERMFAAKTELKDFIEWSKENFGSKMRELESAVKALPNELKANVLLVEQMKEEIETKSTEQFKTICKSLKVDTLRLTELEKHFKTLQELNKKTDKIDLEVKKLRHLEDDVFQINCFIERFLPIQIHHQICEGLNHVAGPDLPELMKFEKIKSMELYKYSKQCEGHKPSIKRLRMALEAFHKHMYRNCYGSAPFTFGDLKDYWPDMPDKYLTTYNKKPYLDARESPILSKLADAEKERQERLEEHITFMFLGERDATKLLLATAVNDLKENMNTNASGRNGGGNRNRQGGGGDKSARGSQHSFAPQQQQQRSDQPSKWFEQKQVSSPGGTQQMPQQPFMQQSNTSGGAEHVNSRESKDKGGRSMGSKGRRNLKQHQAPSGNPSQISVSNAGGGGAKRSRSRTPQNGQDQQQYQRHSEYQQQSSQQQQWSQPQHNNRHQDRGVTTPPLDIISSSQLGSSILGSGYAQSRSQLPRRNSESSSSGQHGESSFNSHSQREGWFQQPQPQVVYETRVVNNTRVINKLDKEMLFQLKKKMRTFMEQGRTEFNGQLNKWQMLFDETSEDQYETESRVIRLETVVGLLTTQIEELQGELKESNDKVELQQEMITSCENYLVEMEEDCDAEEFKGTVESSIQLSSDASSDQQQQKTTFWKEKESPKVKKMKKLDVPQIALSPKGKSPAVVEKQSSKPVLGYKDSGASYADNYAKRGSFSNNFVRRTSIRDTIATRQLKVKQAQEAVMKNQNNGLELIVENVDENDEKVMTKAFTPSSRSKQSNANTGNRLDPTSKTSGNSTPKIKTENLNSKGTSPQTRKQQTTEVVIPSSRQQRLNKLQNASSNVSASASGKEVSAFGKQMKVTNLNEIKDGVRKLMKKKQSVVSSTTSDDTVSSLNTVENKDNTDSEYKMAGISFNFAATMQRKTMNRQELTQLIQDKFNEVAEKTKAYSLLTNFKLEQILQKEVEMKTAITLYQEETRASIKEFIEIQVAELKERGFLLQQKVLGRIQGAEGAVHDFSNRLDINEREIKIMIDRMQQEYTDFLQARKRWKSDFQSADSKNKEHIERVHSMIGGCENQNEVNTRAIKMILDAQMIEQLMQRQEVADRKQLLVMASKNQKDLMSTDGGVNGREVFGPNVDPKKLQHDRMKIRTDNSSPKNMNGYVNAGLTSEKPSPTKYENSFTFATEPPEFEENAASVQPPLLRVDRNCLNCSDNKTMTLNVIKIACLGYTQSPITYQSKNYHVSDLLSVKAQVVAQCQRMLRENLFQTKGNSGIDIRAQDNERSFVITPLLHANPIKVETNLQQFLKNFGHQEQEAYGLGSLALNDQSVQLQDGKQNSLAESSIQQIRENRYPTQLSPKAALQNSVCSGKIILGVDGGDGADIDKPKTKHRNFQEDFIQSQQQQVSTEEDLFSNMQNVSNSILVPNKNAANRGSSQLTQYRKKDNNMLGHSGPTQHPHIRFASTSKIQPDGRSNWDDVRRSQQNCDTGALPDLKKQRIVYPQRAANADFEYMFEISGNASTKHSHVRQSSVLTGNTGKNILASTRYRNGGGNQSALEEHVYRATDGLRQTSKPVSQAIKMKQANRPQTQGDINGQINTGVRRISSYTSSQYK